MRLLIADSDRSLADIYVSFFSGEGYEVETVEDGLQCLNATRQRAPDVLILEYELPWGGGDGVLARLREDFQFAPIDVVVITGNHSEEELAHELGPPVGGYLQKPFHLRELSDMVRSVSGYLPPQTAGGLLKEVTVHTRRVIQP